MALRCSSPLFHPARVLRAALPALALVALLSPPARAAYQVEAVAHGGRIQGHVTLTGKAPANPVITTTKNRDYCGMTIPNPLYVVGDKGGLANVEVFLKDVTKGKALPTDPITLTNAQCMFHPRVQGACVGQKVKIVSEDPVLHNTHPQVAETGASLYNVALPFKGFSVVKPLAATPGLLRIKCDAHEWMRAWIYEFDNPYFATTDKDGNFELTDVPPGTYQLVAWHEVLGEKTSPVTVAADGTATLDVAFTSK